MSLINALVNRTAYSYEDAFKAKDCTTQPMRFAIDDWFQLYFQREPTKDEDPCQRIPYTVVNKITKTVFGEYQASSTDRFAERILETLDVKKQEAMQMALVGGSCLLKPVPLPRGWRWHVVSRANLCVFGRDADGRYSDVGTIEVTTRGANYYTFLERRKVDDRGYLTITNQLYKSTSAASLGSLCSLQELPQYAEYPPSYTFTVPFHSVGLVELRTPMVNCVDGSADAVSVYAAAVGLIHNINRNEAQIDGEFSRGESRIITSSDMMTRDPETGKRRFTDHIFVGLDDDIDNVGVTIFSPELREQSFLARKQEYLRNVENVVGLKRGLLSEVEAAERTATEITSSAGDYNLTIIDFQKMWESAVKEAVRLCGILGPLYKVSEAHEVSEDSVSIDWGNGILFDEDKTWDDYKAMVAAGLLKPEIALGWRFGMPTETPEDLAKIREKYMPEMEKLTEEDE